MSGLFSGLSDQGLEETQDRLGGFQAHDTDVYEATIKVVYAGQSAGGAKSFTVVAVLGDKEYNETIYATNRSGENWFMGGEKKDKKIPLPGFTTINDLCLVTTEKPLAEQDGEEKIVKVWDSEEKKELPKSVPVITGLTGKKVYLGITKTIETQMEKDNDGKYTIPTDKIRTVNAIDKVFHYPSKMTIVEAREGATEAVFHDKWVEKNKGVTRDKTQKGDGKSGAPGSAPQAGQQQKKTTSLFAQK